MNSEQQQLAARSAVRQAARRYGPGWDHISYDTRFGAAMRVVMSELPTYLLYDKYSASDVREISVLVSRAVENT